MSNDLNACRATNQVLSKEVQILRNNLKQSGIKCNEKIKQKDIEVKTCNTNLTSTNGLLDICNNNNNAKLDICNKTITQKEGELNTCKSNAKLLFDGRETCQTELNKCNRYTQPTGTLETNLVLPSLGMPVPISSFTNLGYGHY